MPEDHPAASGPGNAAKPPKVRRRYQKPFVISERTYERGAMACIKTSNTGPTSCTAGTTVGAS